MAFKLSNDAPTMPKTFLEHILSIFEVWSTLAKNAILAIFGENSSSYLAWSAYDMKIIYEKMLETNFLLLKFMSLMVL